uniref:Beta-glucosidase n=1 Tax=Leersia perrieri TaxID=77586 RepID=A0A0D9W663_9ORYZ
MAAAGALLLLPGGLLLLLAAAVASGNAYNGAGEPPPISRRSFPEGFIFGTASSAYQYEGGAAEEMIADRSNGDVASDSYHLYKEDVRIMKDMGMDAYRFSISWTRILPNGSLSGGVNREGIKYYNNLINELLLKGVQPFITLFHWDSPQALEDKYNGFLSPNIINDYKDYAEICFKEFGDRVKHWITFNEPWTFCSNGYATGLFAPGRCSPWEKGNCSVGDSGREPYTACHHQLLAHAETVRLYKEKYQDLQKGKIGITLVSHWFVPYTRSNSNDYAARRALDFMLGCLNMAEGYDNKFLSRGDYPLSMRQLVGNRLPRFTKEQSKLVKGAFDFIGLNYYTTNYADNLPPSNGLNNSYTTDARANLTGVRNGIPIGPQAASPWLYIYPQGFRELLLYVKENYGNPTIYITENGVDEFNNKTLPLQEALKDDTRIDYYHKHLLALLSAIRDGANIKGYFAWSLLDNFEWSNGYTVRFGINFVDYNDGAKRYPKKSAYWFKKFLQNLDMDRVTLPMAAAGIVAFLLLALATVVASDVYNCAGEPRISRRSFPKGFIFGAASSAYQYEGGAAEDKIDDRSNGDVASDSYHLYKEDVRIMRDMGMDAYRFSISWTRILPNGSLSGGVNREGINYYNNLINELLSKGVQPFVTLFHWDSPQALEDRNDYKDYAEVCFKEFGDRVKHWITFNEPWTFCSRGYASGRFAPGRCSPWEKGNCSVGDSGREPYTACHHQLLAHVETVRLYKEKYQALQKGKIGITLVSHWFVPYSRTKSNDYAARRALDFMLGWCLDPLIRGDYPLSMRQLVGDRLPRFTKEQSKLVKGAFDFIGLNYYTANYADNLPPSNGLNNSYTTDARANLTGVRNGIPIGPQAASPWLYIYPQGFRELLLYVKQNYGNPTIYITENGVDEFNNQTLPLQEALKDDIRIEYHHKHLLSLLSAIRDGANVKGYFAWSLIDNFEWANGYTVRFGINFVDYNDGRKRYPKNSAQWFKEFLLKPHFPLPMAAVGAVVMSGGLLFLLVVACIAYNDESVLTPISRRDFPKGFIFGTSSSSYQFEGAVSEGGRGPSIWDAFTHQYPDRIADISNGDVADDTYHLYKDDVRIMKEMGMDAYRFSISWSRIFPNGSLNGGVNREGINYYNGLINELLLKGLQPFVTLFHWDSPQALEDKYKGFLSPNIINDYKDYAEICFKEFGDRVKHWITFNEPWTFCVMGYAFGIYAPGRCSPWEKENCRVGDSGREPYTACHHLILAHAETVRLYKEKYQFTEEAVKKWHFIRNNDLNRRSANWALGVEFVSSQYSALQKGKIGITVNSDWYVPMSKSKSSNDAAIRALDFMLGWFMDPLITGHYPLSMRELVGDRLPEFNKAQSEMVKGAFDFIGLNYYSSNYADNVPPSYGLNNSYNTDSQTKITDSQNGTLIGPQAASPWLHVYPEGFHELLLYIKDNYGDPTIYITENGVDEVNNKTMPLKEALKDDARIEYYHKHLLALLRAMRDGANVKGYFAWSLLDNFEWSAGYTVRFGMTFVDYNDGMKRYPKNSAQWFKKFLLK